MDYLSGLNERQKEAVLCKNGALLIVAGAGAGKTKTVTHRIVYLISEGISPENILAVTFTNKAAKEMVERVGHMLEGKVKERPMIATFHSLAVKILRDNAEKIGLNRHFVILDDSDTNSIIRDVLKDLNIDPKQSPIRMFKSIISSQKNNFVSLDEFGKNAQSYNSQVIARVWQKYEEKKMKEKGLDFDDLLLKTVILFQENKDVLDVYQERWKYIHVDEYQDTNTVQYMLTKLLAKKYGNICVVGDSDQNIYSWRGADITNILNFEEDYPGAKVILLEQNYRSTKNIIEVANHIIRKNKQRKDKNLFTENEDGELISLFEAYNDKYEAEFVADKVTEMMDKGVNPNDIAILYRANFQSRLFEEYMLKYSLPYQVLGVRFFDRKEIKDVLSYIRASLNPDSLSDIKRIINEPKRGLGKTTLDKFFAGQESVLPLKTRLKIKSFYESLEKIKNFEENHKPSEAVAFAIKESGIEADLLKSGLEDDLERLENVRELITFATKYDELDKMEGIELLLEEAALASDQDTLSETVKKKPKNGVKLMTVHASKGLEFEHVFIVGLEDDLFPHGKKSTTRDYNEEEERRLFYVAVTRSKKKLFLSYATIRMVFGNIEVRNPSEFLGDIPEELIHREERDSSGFGNNIVYI
ncbi:MAG: ATP-dependent helicase UvrD/PcrA [Patescibacteria group bacterium]|nr:ATP-dependent helicase UvrD/PcrA [Patescibacteria group bacterium]